MAEEGIGSYDSRPKESKGNRGSLGVVRRGRIRVLRLLVRMLRLAYVMFFSSMSVVMSVECMGFLRTWIVVPVAANFQFGL